MKQEKAVYRDLIESYTVYTCSLPTQICICLSGRAALCLPLRAFAPFRRDGVWKM